MRVSDLMPLIYENNLEMLNIINSEEQELETNFKPNLELTYSNNYVILANEVGITNYERMLNIKADPTKESLEFRRNRIINRLSTTVPYNLAYLENKLNEIMGVGNWQLSIDYNSYTITIEALQIGSNWYNELLKLLDNIIPCNMVIKINLLYTTWEYAQEKHPTWNDMLNYTWEQIREGV